MYEKKNIIHFRAEIRRHSGALKKKEKIHPESRKNQGKNKSSGELQPQPAIAWKSTAVLQLMSPSIQVVSLVLVLKDWYQVLGPRVFPSKHWQPAQARLDSVAVGCCYFVASKSPRFEPRCPATFLCPKPCTTGPSSHFSRMTNRSTLLYLFKNI